MACEQERAIFQNATLAVDTAALAVDEATAILASNMAALMLAQANLTACELNATPRPGLTPRPKSKSIQSQEYLQKLQLQIDKMSQKMLDLKKLVH